MTKSTVPCPSNQIAPLHRRDVFFLIQDPPMEDVFMVGNVFTLLSTMYLMLRISITRDRRGDVVIKVQDQSEQPGMSRDQRKV